MTDSPDDRPNGRDEPTADAQVPRDAEWTLVSQVHYDPAERDGLTIAIIDAVAEAEGVPPTAILDPPLYDSVDAGELESSLFDAGGDDSPDAGAVEFMYRRYRVVVRQDGWVLVYERAGS